MPLDLVEVSIVPTKQSVLYVTDLAYEARGRRYCDEDIFLSSQLASDFHTALCHPRHVVALMDRFDVVLVRNSGPMMNHEADYEAFRKRAAATGACVYNPLTGKADMRGKQYLVDMTRLGLPVIPTADGPGGLGRLPDAAEYIVKPKQGADSIGLSVISKSALPNIGEDLLVQPRVGFQHEVSFYFVDRTFHYALYAPSVERRWELKPYEPDAADLAFAQRFVDWNDIDHGVQRVDACRTDDGRLLLIELEDLNPYLSLDALHDRVRATFVRALKRSLKAHLARHGGRRGTAAGTKCDG